MGEQSVSENPPVDPEQWLHVYEQMYKIRAFENATNDLYLTAKMPGLAHLYIGEEAVAVGICEALRRDDYITSTHRGHGHSIAKGAAVDRMFAELLGKEAGYCRGKGGSMHIADQETGNLGANAIVGGSAGIATGAALSIKMRSSGQVAVCFFGDGALGQGLFYEVANMAALWKLPVIYVVEHNLYGEYTHHTETAAGLLGIPAAEVTRQQRSIAKAVNFGIVYGQSAFGLAQQQKLSRDEATEYIRRYKERFPEIEDFRQRTLAAAREDGYVETLLGRRRPVPDLASGNFNARAAAERVAINTPVQGSAADLIKRAMLSVDRRLAAEFPGQKLLLQVHDELLLEVDDAEADAVAAMVREEMISALELSVPLVVEVGKGRNWDEAH